MPPYTTAHFLKLPMPPLAVSDEAHRVKELSLSSYPPFTGEVLRWPNFKRIVRDYCNNHPPVDLPLSKDDPQTAINQEVFLCAQEKSIEGRFTHQVMHVVEHCANVTHLPVRLADFKAAAATGRSTEPDFACVTRDMHQNLRFVGECKADFKNELPEDYKRSAETDFKAARFVRRWLSQPITYCIVYQVKFAFVTTYNYTMFICLPTHVNSRMATEYDRAYISEPIAYSSQDTNTGNGVTVRQAMWYLMNESRSHYRSEPRSLPSLKDVSHLTSKNMYKGASTNFRDPPGAPPSQGSTDPQNTGGGGYNNGAAQMKTAAASFTRWKLKNGEKENILKMKWEGKEFLLPPQKIRATQVNGRRAYIGEVAIATRSGDRVVPFLLDTRERIGKGEMEKYLTKKHLEIRSK